MLFYPYWLWCQPYHIQNPCSYHIVFILSYNSIFDEIFKHVYKAQSQELL